MASAAPSPQAALSAAPSPQAALSAAEALALRMASLLLRDAGTAPAPTGVADVVTWFGAMQSQDLGSGLWSLGVRLPGRTQADIEAALERREALRTWPMRGTVHLVPARDARWMLEVTGQRAFDGAAARRAYLGLSDEHANAAVDALATALAGGGRKTRAECVAVFESSGVPSSGSLGYHLLWYASQQGVTCIAPNVGKEQTFVLLDEWVPDAHRPGRDQGLALLALRYFRSHGPTTRQDFAGWTGLTAADAKRGIAGAGEQLVTVAVEGREMIMAAAALDAVSAAGGAAVAGLGDDEMWVLPGFDEYLLGFKDRSMMLDADHKQAIIPGGNGVFRPTVVRAGRVVGTWRRAVGRTKVTVDVQPLVRLARTDRARVESALQPYGFFVGRPVEVRWPVG